MLKRLFVVAASSLLATGLISCASDNAPVPQPMPKIKSYDVIRQGWLQRNLDDSPAGSFTPAGFDNAVFTADSSGTIYKIDPTDGSIINSFYLREPLSSGIGVSGGLIFVTTLDAHLLAVDKGNGKIKWKMRLPTLSLEAPQVGADLVIVRTNDAEVLAYNVNDGTPVWVYQKPSPPLTLRVTNTFQVIGNEVIAIGMPGGKLALVNLKTGVPIWENYVAIPEGATDLDKITDIGMRPVLDDKRLYVATYNGKIACIDAISSNILWEKKFSTSVGLTFDQQNIYAVSQDGVVYAFDKATGAQVWKNTSMQYRNLGMPAILGNGIIVVDNDGYIHFFNRNDGQETARLSSNMSGGISNPLVRDNGVIVQSANGMLELIKNY